MANLKKNLLYNISYQLLLIILPLITAPYVSRVLGVNGVGTYSYTYSIAYYFCLFGMLGISNHGNRSIALARGNELEISKLFWTIYLIQFVTMFVALIGYLIYVSVFFQGDKVIAYIDCLFLLSFMFDINWLFFGMEKFKITVSRNIVFKISTILCIFTFVKEPSDLWKYTLILAFGTFLCQSYLWIFLKKFICFVVPSWSDVKKQVKPILTLFIPVIAYSIYKVMDKIMLGSITSVTQVGLYENAEKIIGIPVGIITAFGTVMMPRISSLLAENNSKKVDEYNKISFRYFSILAIGMNFGLIGISSVLPSVYFGVEFSECTPLIAGLSFTLVFMTWANIIRTQYLIPNRLDKPYVVSTICGAFVNFFVNLLLIPIFESKGALLGTVLAEFIVFFVQTWYVRKEFSVIEYLKPCIVFFGFGIVMAGVVYMFGFTYGESIGTLVIQIVLGLIIYGFFSLTYLLIIRDQVIMDLLRKVNSFISKRGR